MSFHTLDATSQYKDCGKGTDCPAVPLRLMRFHEPTPAVRNSASLHSGEAGLDTHNLTKRVSLSGPGRIAELAGVLLQNGRLWSLVSPALQGPATSSLEGRGRLPEVNRHGVRRDGVQAPSLAQVPAPPVARLLSRKLPVERRHCRIWLVQEQLDTCRSAGKQLPLLT